MNKEIIEKAEEIRDEVQVGANTAKRIGGILTVMAREANGLYENVLDWINNEKPQGGGFILTQSDIINSLNNENELKPLSAKQGKILKETLDELVVDNLETNDETKALSALQGKNLADDLREHNHDGIYQPLGNSVYVTTLPIVDIIKKDVTQIDHEQELEIEKLINLSTKNVLIMLPSGEMNFFIGDDFYALNSYSIPITFEINAATGINIYFTIASIDTIGIINIYTSGAYNTGTPWVLSSVKLGPSV